MPRAWPVDDRIFEPKANLRPVDGVGNRPTHREQPAGAGTFELMLDERPVVDIKFTGRPVDEQVEKPTGDEKRTPVTDNCTTTRHLRLVHTRFVCQWSVQTLNEN